MHRLRSVSANPALMKANMLRRRTGDPLLVDKCCSKMKEAKGLRVEAQQLREERNRLARGSAPISHQVGAGLRRQLKEIEGKLGGIEQELKGMQFPNEIHQSVPDENTVIRMSGECRQFSFQPKDHLTIARSLGLVDFASGTKIVGHKFAVLTGMGAVLEMALIQWAIDRARKEGFTLLSLPEVIGEHVLNGCGYQPRASGSDADPGLADQSYFLTGGERVLSATAELPLVGCVSKRAFPLSSLPAKAVAFGHAFRAEAGAMGAASRGLYRLHQFSKVEMFAVTSPDDSERILEQFVGLEESMHQELGLHCRVLEMAAHELGAPAYHKYDLEAWMPGRGGFGEVCSASNCTDYQAQRMDIRIKGGAFAHTVNATVCAVQRVMVALLEQHQQEDGSVVLPKALHPYMGVQCLKADDMGIWAGR